MAQQNKDFNIVMASDEKYVSYLETAIKSISDINKNIPIKLYTCNALTYFESIKGKNIQKVQVTPPSNFSKYFDNQSAYNHALTRIAKLAAMIENDTAKTMYLDSDIIAYQDIAKITKELKINTENTVYLLLKRPQIISIMDIGWLYFKNFSKMTVKEMASVINDTLGTNYTDKDLTALNCWNGGIVYGSGSGVRLLAGQWKINYLKMLTGKNRSVFIPNDQLCLWIASDQLKKKVDFKELPLAWNFMPGHATEELAKTNPNPDDIKKHLKGVNILHLAQNKTDIWAQILINEVNSK